MLLAGWLPDGACRSGHPFQLTPFGVSLDDSRGMWEESLAILSKAWTEEVFAYQGKYYHVPPREVVPKPLQKPHPPPLILTLSRWERKPSSASTELN